MSSDGEKTGDQEPGGEPANPGASDYALSVWLAEHPKALVASIGNDGRPVPMPESLPLLPSHEVDERPFLSLVAPQEASRVVAAFNDALQNGLAVVRIKMADGQGEVDLYYADVRPTHGVMLRLVLPVASGEVAEALTPADFQSRPRLANIEKDEVSAIRAIDEATSLLLGWSEAEMVGKRTLEFIHPDDHPRAIDNWMEMIAHGVRHAVRLRYRTKDGDWLWLETSNELSHDESGRRRVACQMIDISEEMAAVEALRYSEQVLRRMAETVPVGLGEIAPDQSFRYTNSTFRALLGREEVGSLDEVLAGVDPADAALLEQAVGAALRSGSDADVDVRLSSTASAPERMCRVALRPVVDDGQVLGALICVMDVTDLKLQAATDPLTGLHNRSAIFEALRQALTAEGPVGVVFLDVDQFKSINDNFGHDAGDAALTRLADALRGAVRKGDLVGRVGGDEFLVVCRAVASAEDLIEVSRRIQEEAVAALGDGNGSRFSRASVGVALVAAGSISAEDAVARADAAMYHAKRRPEAGPVLWSDELSLGASAAGH